MSSTNGKLRAPKLPAPIITGGLIAVGGYVLYRMIRKDSSPAHGLDDAIDDTIDKSKQKVNAAKEAVKDTSNDARRSGRDVAHDVRHRGRDDYSRRD